MIKVKDFCKAFDMVEHCIMTIKIRGCDGKKFFLLEMDSYDYDTAGITDVTDKWKKMAQEFVEKFGEYSILDGSLKIENYELSVDLLLKDKKYELE